ncbi:MAG: motility associated factor glycosyltransferase family protein [Spirochaetes bacterium]|nr:motility associated factor glycosyltransferase family protein [Spirochaetota bacterium]
MKSFFEESILKIKNNNPVLFSILQKAGESDKVTAIDSKTGDKIPLLEIDNKKILIHSRFDPAKEAARLIAETNLLNIDLFIVFGFGFAYHIEELTKKIGPDSTVLVLEKDPAIIREAISSRNLTALLSDERIKIIADPDEEKIAEMMKGRSSHRVSMVIQRGSFQLDPAYYSNLNRIIKSYLSTKEVNIATLSRFEKTWASNIARNIPEFIRHPGANIFYDRFKDIPAIVAGAGPSLTSSIDFIKSNIDKAVIICVDTSYRILRWHGIVPHFCITVDPQVINARYFEGDVKSETVYITDPTVHPSSFRLIKGDIASVGMVFDMMKWIEKIAGEKGELAYGGSVMTNAYDFAKRIGSSPVVLVGQDLAFTGGLAHARGAYLDEEVFLYSNRFYNAQMKNRLQLSALPKIRVNGIRAQEAYTNQKLMIFLSWFEKRNDPDLVNASFNGAYIKGVKHSSSEELIFKQAEKDIFKLIHEVYSANEIKPEVSAAIGKSLLAKCAVMRDELNSLSETVKRAVALSGELVELVKKNNKNSKLDYILKKLSETDKILNSKTGIKEMIGFTVQRVIHTITEGYEIDSEDDTISKEELVAKRSRFLYEGILEGTEFNRKIVDKMIKLLEF